MDIDLAALPDDVGALQRLVRSLAANDQPIRRHPNAQHQWHQRPTSHFVFERKKQVLLFIETANLHEQPLRLVLDRIRVQA